MSTMASQITDVSIVCSTVCSGTDKKNHQSSVSLAFVRGIHRSPVVFPHKGPITQKMFPFDGVLLMQFYFHNHKWLFWAKYADDLAGSCHYLNQHWLIVNWTHGNKLQWNFNQKILRQRDLKIFSAKHQLFCSNLDMFSPTKIFYMNFITDFYKTQSLHFTGAPWWPGTRPWNLHWLHTGDIAVLQRALHHRDSIWIAMPQNSNAVSDSIQPVQLLELIGRKLYNNWMGYHRTRHYGRQCDKPSNHKYIHDLMQDCGGSSTLTHSLWIKWLLFHWWYFQMLFREWKVVWCIFINISRRFFLRF